MSKKSHEELMRYFFKDSRGENTFPRKQKLKGKEMFKEIDKIIHFCLRFLGNTTVFF